MAELLTQTNSRTEPTPKPVNKLKHARLSSVIISPLQKGKGVGVNVWRNVLNQIRDISYPSKVFATLDSYVIFSIT
jgi:hypothetical protein